MQAIHLKIYNSLNQYLSVKYDHVYKSTIYLWKIAMGKRSDKIIFYMIPRDSNINNAFSVMYSNLI